METKVKTKVKIKDLETLLTEWKYLSRDMLTIIEWVGKDMTFMPVKYIGWTFMCEDSWDYYYFKKLNQAIWKTFTY